MSEGAVKWANYDKGFGFIEESDGDKDAFVHVSWVERASINDLREGPKLCFDLVADQDTGRLSASHLQLLS